MVRSENRIKLGDGGGGMGERRAKLEFCSEITAPYVVLHYPCLNQESLTKSLLFEFLVSKLRKHNLLPKACG